MKFINIPITILVYIEIIAESHNTRILAFGLGY